ncbi:MAG: hypothetical protein KI792_04105 [Alphaproteobacteria bacterium]|nr:hypothetical protein [Alphaproteobacteria bacterium SS10]
MATVSMVRSDLDRLSRDYGALKNDLGHHRLTITREAEAQRAPIMAVLNDLLDRHLSALEPGSLKPFAGLPDKRGNAFDPVKRLSNQRRGQARAQTAYDAVSTHDKGREYYRVESDMRDNRRAQAAAERRVEALAKVVEPIEVANRRLISAGGKTICAETIKEYERFSLGRWMNDPNYATARQGLAEYRRAAKRAGLYYTPMKHVEAYNDAVLEKAQLETAGDNLRLEFQASQGRNELTTDDDIRGNLRHWIQREAKSAGFIEKLAADPISDGRLDDLLENAVRAEAMDQMIDQLTSGITAVETGKRRVDDQRRQLSGKRGTVRSYSSHDLSRGFENMASRLRAAARQASDLHVAVRDYKFEVVPDRGAGADRSSNPITPMMYLTMATAVLVGMSAYEQGRGAGLLGVSKDDFSGQGVDIGDLNIGSHISGISAPDFSAPDVSVSDPGSDPGLSGFDPSGGFGLY